MMLVTLALILAAQSAPDAAAATDDPEIVVTAERFAKWRGVARSGKSGWRCRTRETSGSRAIDATSCQILVACIAEESTRQGVDNMFAQAKTKPSQESMDRVGLCLKTRRDAAIAAYAAQNRR